MGIDILDGKFDEDSFDDGFDPDFPDKYDEDFEVEDEDFDPELAAGVEGEADDEILDLGQDVKAWCGRCRDTVPHTIVTRKDGAIRQVLCNVCGDEHLFRTKEDRTTRTPAKPFRDERNLDWAALASQVDPATVRDYAASDRYTEGEALRHARFGLGFVVEVKGPNKMDVLFESGCKRLVFGRA